jgi:hypothetical protein
MKSRESESAFARCPYGEFRIAEHQPARDDDISVQFRVQAHRG